MVFSFLLGANVLVEKVFAWPGVGSYALEALIASDYAPVQGFVLTMAMLYVLLNLAIDVLYGVVDPRVADRGVSAGPARHARYVIGENPVTLGRLRAVRAASCWSASPARWLVPYDPLASDTAHGAPAAVRARTGSVPTSSAATS